MLNWIKEKLRKVKEFFKNIFKTCLVKASSTLTKLENKTESKFVKSIIRFANKTVCTFFGSIIYFIDYVTRPVCLVLIGLNVLFGFYYGAYLVVYFNIGCGIGEATVRNEELMEVSEIISDTEDKLRILKSL